MTSKERYLAAIKGEPRDRVPVTPIFMAWAAHFVGHTYRDFYLNADILAEGQLAVTRAFGVDQISAISDPWRESSAYGMEFTYPDQAVGKPAEHILKSPEDAKKLVRVDIENSPRLKDRLEAIRKMAAEVGETHSVQGWVEGPIAQYADLRGVQETMMDLIEDPSLYLESVETIVDNALEFAKAQLAAGAETIGCGDAVASLIGPDLYVRYVLPWETKLFAGIHEAGGLVETHICGDINNIVEHIAKTGTDIIDVDWMVPLDKARKLVGDEIALCGNFDPTAVLLQGTPEDIADAARKCIADGGDRFLLMPGCEIPQGTAEANIRAFCPCEGSLIADALQRS